MSAGIVIPWRWQDPDEASPTYAWRVQRLPRVLIAATQTLPTVLAALPIGEPWSPGIARNYGARAAAFDPIVFIDADTITPAAQVHEAARLAAEAPGLVYGYTLYLRLDAQERVEQELVNVGSMGCAAISRACFEEAGGFDPGFSGWGYEDLDFAGRCGERWPTRRVDGPCRHLWHGLRNGDDSPSDADAAETAANLERWRSKTTQSTP